MKLSKELWDKLVKYGQEHLAVGFDELSDEEAKSFEKERVIKILKKLKKKM